jgi:hypothetical protein
MKYQDVFSKSGPFSPAYWINNDSIWEYISVTGKQYDIRFYQNMGSEEHPVAIAQMQQMEDSLLAIGFQNVSSRLIQGGDHNEQTWRDDFDDAYLWLFASYALISELNDPLPLFVFPNPASSSISLGGVEMGPEDQVSIMDSSGKIYKTVSGSDTIQISELPAGVYIVSIDIDSRNYSGRFVKQ